MLLRDQHAEEATGLTEVPDRLRDLALGVPHLPVVDHAAKLFRRPVEEGLLLSGQSDRRNGAQLGPVRAAGEELGVEADGARLERLRLGV